MRSPRPRRWRNPRRTRISRILPAPQTCNFIVFSTPDRIQGSAGGFPFRASAASRTPAGRRPSAAVGGGCAPARPAPFGAGRPAGGFPSPLICGFLPAGYRTGQKPSLPAGPRPCDRPAPHPAQKEKMFAPLDRCPKCWYNVLGKLRDMGELPWQQKQKRNTAMRVFPP